jgi:glucose-1-phosphate cytidylyltransferase
MIEIGSLPILCHIMKYYLKFGFNDFVICCGYKGHMIKEYFSNYYLHNSDITFDFLQGNKMIVHETFSEPFKVTLVDTGVDTMTGGRIKRIQKYVQGERFMLTYGDGLSDIDINALIKFHDVHKKIVTLTAVQQAGRFGALVIDKNNSVLNFSEKATPEEDIGWINGGFMVCEPAVFDYLSNDSTVFENEPLEHLSRDNQLAAYKHKGFWQCMDTLRDKMFIERLWESKKAPWRA